MVEASRKGEAKKISVVCAHDEEVLLSLNHAVKEGIVNPILVGKKKEIEALISKLKLDHFTAEIIDCDNDEKCAEIAVKQVNSGQSQLLMKGLIATSTFLKAVLNKEWGLRLGGLLSHVTVFEVEGYDHLFLLSDVAMNIAPDLNQKKMIIENAVAIGHKLGIEKPKVAPLCAVEVVNPDMPATIDAAILSKMAERGQIKGCLIDGPLALDNAVSVEAAKHKKITSPVAGNADILLAPNIESGNVLYKALGFFTSAKIAAVITGAKAPIVLTSRADTDETKFNSIALACVLS
ncbi:MAG: phosphate butyryltransferase [Candidatus Wallbacteria bacterium]|nr:phosphate butyryltransferase [Candidatus Wallbacteria bacterium]